MPRQTFGNLDKLHSSSLVRSQTPGFPPLPLAVSPRDARWEIAAPVPSRHVPEGRFAQATGEDRDRWLRSQRPRAVVASGRIPHLLVGLAVVERTESRHCIAGRSNPIVAKPPGPPAAAARWSRQFLGVVQGRIFRRPGSDSARLLGLLVEDLDVALPHATGKAVDFLAVAVLEAHAVQVEV